MTKERLLKFKLLATRKSEEAEKILSGDRDNYDGADGARYVLELCDCIFELVDALQSTIVSDGK